MYLRAYLTQTKRGLMNWKTDQEKSFQKKYREVKVRKKYEKR